MDVCYGDCGGPVDGQEGLRAVLDNRKDQRERGREREGERDYIYIHLILLIELTQSDSL